MIDPRTDGPSIVTDVLNQIHEITRNGYVMVYFHVYVPRWLESKLNQPYSDQTRDKTLFDRLHDIPKVTTVKSGNYSRVTVLFWSGDDFLGNPATL